MGSEVIDSQGAPKCDICAFCLKPGADTRYNPTFWVLVHRACLDEPGRLEAIAHGKCFFCLDDRLMPAVALFAPATPTDFPWDDIDELAWAHSECVARYEAALDGAAIPLLKGQKQEGDP